MCRTKSTVAGLETKLPKSFLKFAVYNIVEENTIQQYNQMKDGYRI